MNIIKPFFKRSWVQFTNILYISQIYTYTESEKLSATHTHIDGWRSSEALSVLSAAGSICMAYKKLFCMYACDIYVYFSPDTGKIVIWGKFLLKEINLFLAGIERGSYSPYQLCRDL